MKQHKVISPQCLPTRSPALFGFVLWLLLDRLQPPGWVHGVLWCMYVLVALAWLIEFFKENPARVDGFGPKDGDA